MANNPSKDESIPRIVEVLAAAKHITEIAARGHSYYITESGRHLGSGGPWAELINAVHALSPPVETPAPLNDEEQAALYGYCMRDPRMYALLRRLTSAGLVPDPEPAETPVALTLAHLSPENVQRVLDRHLRWRETALGFFRQILDGRGTEDEWPALAEFVRNSTVVPVLNSPEKSTTEPQS